MPPEAEKPVNNVLSPVRHEPGVISASSPLMWLNLLSLDAPAVAVLWQLLFARCFHVRLSPGVTVLLGLVVWMIYVSDRLLDVWRTPAQRTEAIRHRFYRRHWRGFLLPMGVAFLLAGWMSLKYLDAQTFRGGIALSLAVGIYFALIHLRQPVKHPWLPKEMLVGVLFGLGTCFPVWERLPDHGVLMLGPYLVFTTLCWINCAAIEYSEWAHLRQRQFNSPHPWTIGVGRHLTLAASATAIISLCFIPANSGNLAWPLLAAETLSAAVFAALGLRSQLLSTDQFRVLMDLALFTPILFFPLCIPGVVDPPLVVR